MIVSVASGKGGTGKTSVAVNMALSVGKVQLLDCDVEEPNAYLLLHPEINKKEPVYTLIPKINREFVTLVVNAQNSASSTLYLQPQRKSLFFQIYVIVAVDALWFAPERQSAWEKHKIGTLKFGAADWVALVYGELEVSKPMAVPVIKAVKKQIKEGEKCNS